MILKKCIAYDNPCYTQSSRIQDKPYGIVVHSTGCDNEYLKRYVQPSETDTEKNNILKDIGVNVYSNDLNKPNAEICMHAFIGKNAKDIVEVYQTLPYNICCWGCGRGNKGSYNYNPTPCIQFEICEDDLTDKEYFNKAFQTAIEYCAYLVNLYKIPIGHIVSHKEACDLGYASNHGDPEHWLAMYDKSMNWFRGEVKKKINSITDTDIYYAVQVGAFKSRENAEAMLEKLKKSGYNGYITTKGV